MTIQRALALASTTVAGTLLCSGGLLLLHPGDPGLIAITVQLLLLLVMISPLWLLRPRLATSPLPTPPWGRQWRTAPPAAKAHPVARWMLIRLRFRAALIDTPPAPPAQPTLPQNRRVVAKAAPPRVNPRRLRMLFRRPALTLPSPTLDIEFVAPGRRTVHQVNEPGMQAHLLQLAESVLRATLEPPWPTVLALHDQPRQLILQFATATLLTTAQQRIVVDGLRQQGVLATWSDIASLTVRREALQREPSTQLPESDTLWVPVVAQRQTTTWWPLPRHEHLLLAGHSAAPLAGILQRASDRTLLIHDLDGRLRDQADQIGRLVAQPDALNQARRLQLQYRFTHERATVRPDWRPPLCLVVAPTEQIWPEVQPLLVPDSGVQVVLILGDLPPIAPLRALCYRLPVIEIAQALTPPLPETFRPAGVPIPRPGQAVAWMRGGSVWWRGRAPAIAEATEAA